MSIHSSTPTTGVAKLRVDGYDVSGKMRKRTH
jgi:hypothetical protein